MYKNRNDVLNDKKEEKQRRRQSFIGLIATGQTMIFSHVSDQFNGKFDQGPPFNMQPHGISHVSIYQ